MELYKEKPTHTYQINRNWRTRCCLLIDAIKCCNSEPLLNEMNKLNFSVRTGKSTKKKKKNNSIRCWKEKWEWKMVDSCMHENPFSWHQILLSVGRREWTLSVCEHFMFVKLNLVPRVFLLLLLHSQSCVADSLPISLQRNCIEGAFSLTLKT